MSVGCGIKQTVIACLWRELIIAFEYEQKCPTFNATKNVTTKKIASLGLIVLNHFSLEKMNREECEGFLGIRVWPLHQASILIWYDLGRNYFDMHIIFVFILSL